MPVDDAADGSWQQKIQGDSEELCLHALVGEGTPKLHHPLSEGILSLVRSFREQEGKGQNTLDGRCDGIWANP